MEPRAQWVVNMNVSFTIILLQWVNKYRLETDDVQAKVREGLVY